MTTDRQRAAPTDRRLAGVLSALRLRHLLPAILLAWLGQIVAADAPTPSFPCARASTAAEHAICSHPGLATGDVAVMRSYRAALARLDAAAATALKADQRDFIALRDSIMEGASAASEAGLPAQDPIADLASLQRERSMFLDAIGPAPVGTFPGTWKTLTGEISIRRDAGALTVHLNAAEPSTGRWVCEFAGHGRIVDGPVVTVKPDDGVGAALSLRRVGDTLLVRALPVSGNGTPDQGYCGLNGSVEGRYFHVASSPVVPARRR